MVLCTHFVLFRILVHMTNELAFFRGNEWAFFEVLRNTDIWSCLKQRMYIGQKKATMATYLNVI
jgi:hypothetical protein